jgi:hypothetical protein
MAEAVQHPVFRIRDLAGMVWLFRLQGIMTAVMEVLQAESNRQEM